MPELSPAEVAPLLQKRVAELCPPGVTMTVRTIHSGEGVNVPLDSVFMRAAESALEQEWGRAPVFEREGGSVPIAALFSKILHAPVVLMGTGLMDTICPPSTQFAAYNKITAKKQQIIYPDFGHEGLPRWNDSVFQFLCGML